MEKIKVKIKRINKNAKMPIHGTDEAAGFDLSSLDNYILNPGQILKIPTGLAFEIPKGFFLMIASRSGLAVKGIVQLGSVIDSDYRGEVHFILYNSSEEKYFIEKGDRIAQAVLIPVFRADFFEAENLNETKRGTGGFHSTGKK